MKVIFVLLSVALAAVNARPGGYTLIGGVYEPTSQLDYMEAAKSAGKLAWNKKLEGELSFEDSDRGERNAEYIPTFFTSAQGHQALLEARPASVASSAGARPQRQAVLTQPLYYQGRQ